MKRVLIYLLVFVLFSSCNDKREDLIIGTWVESYDKIDYPSYDPNWEITRYTFYKDGSGTIQNQKRGEELGNPRNMSYKFIHDGKILQITYEDFSGKMPRSIRDEFQIVKLTKNRMEFWMSELINLTFRKVQFVN